MIDQQKAGLLRHAVTLIEVMVVLATIAVLTGLLLPAVQRVRERAARAACQNNLKQMGLALQQFHDVNRAFPIGHTLDERGEQFPLIGWPARILPYVGQAPLWRQAELDYARIRLPTDHLGMKTPVRNYSCPSDGRADTPQITYDTRRDPPFAASVALTNYVGVIGTDSGHGDGVLIGGHSISLADVLDGASDTLMVGERPPSADFGWGLWYAGGTTAQGGGEYDMLLGVRDLKFGTDLARRFCPGGPYSFQPDSMENVCNMFHYWSLHPGGGNFLFCDGAVRFLSYSADSILPALATRAGGEVVTPPD